MQSISQEEREYHVQQMRANFAIEDLHADADDMIMQQRYIDGTINFQDLLLYAKAFVSYSKNIKAV